MTYRKEAPPSDFAELATLNHEMEEGRREKEKEGGRKREREREREEHKLPRERKLELNS